MPRNSLSALPSHTAAVGGESQIENGVRNQYGPPIGPDASRPSIMTELRDVNRARWPLVAENGEQRRKLPARKRRLTKRRTAFPLAGPSRHRRCNSTLSETPAGWRAARSRDTWRRDGDRPAASGAGSRCESGRRGTV